MISLLIFGLSIFHSTTFLLFMITFLLVFISILLPSTFYLMRSKLGKLRALIKEKSQNNLIVGLFHPYCNAGGGGERVLWVALEALQRHYPTADFYVYTGDCEFTPTEIINKVERILNVRGLNEDKIKFIYLNKRRWIEDRQYPCLTLLGQALGSIILGLEAIFQLNPDIFIETTGFSFTLPIFKYLGQCKTGCYIHYPTITKQMMKRVTNRETLYNNQRIIARSPIFTYGKLIYYQIFARLYTLACQCSDIILVNSTFTLTHLNDLSINNLHLVYPPCDVDVFKQIQRPSLSSSSSSSNGNCIRILSVAQFRPEKNHQLQLQCLYELREIIDEEIFDKITLVLCGSCRNIDDSDRVLDLKDLSKHLSLENNVEFKLNLTYNELINEFKLAFIGIHTMLDEHFGIGIVEMMASGLITIAHNSGGPLLDIIETVEGSRLGFLAHTADEYAHTIKYIINKNYQDELNSIRERARASVDRFNNQKFQDEIIRATQPLFK